MVQGILRSPRSHAAMFFSGLSVSFLVTFCAGSGASQSADDFAALEARVAALEESDVDQDAHLDTIDGQVGTVLIHWGNANAPDGTTLIYSGFGYANNYTDTGIHQPIVVQTGDPGGSGDASSLLKPLISSGSTVSGVTSGRYITAAVVHVDAPATVLWGSQTAPAGWSAIYRGHAFGPHSTHNATAPICLDSDDFDASNTVSGSNLANVYPVEVADSAPGDSALVNKLVTCVVIRQD